MEGGYNVGTRSVVGLGCHITILKLIFHTLTLPLKRSLSKIGLVTQESDIYNNKNLLSWRIKIFIPFLSRKIAKEDTL